MSQHVRLLSPRCESHVHIYPEQDHQLESRMRENRQSGSEGGGGREASPYPYRGFANQARAPDALARDDIGVTIVKMRTFVHVAICQILVRPVV